MSGMAMANGIENADVVPRSCPTKRHDQLSRYHGRADVMR